MACGMAGGSAFGDTTPLTMLDSNLEASVPIYLGVPEPSALALLSLAGLLAFRRRR